MMTEANTVVQLEQQHHQQHPLKARTTIMIYDHDGDNMEIVAGGGGTIGLSHNIPDPVHVSGLIFNQVMDEG